MSADLFEPVRPDDHDAVATAVALNEAARAVDDPQSPPQTPEMLAGGLRYGWDLEPGTAFLYRPDPAGSPVGRLTIHAPERDNRQLVTADLVVHPQHRRQGHGTAMMAEVLRKTEQLGRTIIWTGCAHDDAGAAAFLTGQGFRYASHEARRYQWPAQLDHDQLDRLYRTAREAAADYDLARTTAPTSEPLLAELVEVTAAINDAPMGELAFEDEVFDLQRLKDFETAALGKGETLYRVSARHRETGTVGGHTIMMVQPSRPTYAEQYDTAVHRGHRGHRLGLLLKLEMMRWLADVEPQVERIETWNHADNDYMISVNEKIGYRLSRVFDTYQRKLA
jgi:RimJ/RimL family protein N-acetyltransferase